MLQQQKNGWMDEWLGREPGPASKAAWGGPWAYVCMSRFPDLLSLLFALPSPCRPSHKARRVTEPARMPQAARVGKGKKSGREWKDGRPATGSSDARLGSPGMRERVRYVRWICSGRGSLSQDEEDDVLGSSTLLRPSDSERRSRLSGLMSGLRSTATSASPASQSSKQSPSKRQTDDDDDDKHGAGQGPEKATQAEQSISIVCPVNFLGVMIVGPINQCRPKVAAGPQTRLERKTIPGAYPERCAVYCPSETRGFLLSSSARRRQWDGEGQVLNRGMSVEEAAVMNISP